MTHPFLRGVSFPALAILILFLNACGQKKGSTSSDVRPMDPWVFRSVLDSLPRILTLALHDNVWAAYHTDSCSLYKVWNGRVKFQGAVYDHAHGPQPLSLGAGWLENPYRQPWSVTQNGLELLNEVRYGGHSILQGRVTIHYNLILKDNRIIRVDEQPEYMEADGQMGFSRTFSIENAKENEEVTFKTRANSIALHSNIQTNGKWNVLSETKTEKDGTQSMIVDGILTLNHSKPTTFNIQFVKSPTLPNRNKSNQGEELMSLGARLIEKNDCKTCHNEKVSTIGPSYLQIAQRYPNTAEAASLLVQKVISGGTGVWGSQVMTPHPELPISDAEEMVSYILKLDTTDLGQQPGQSAGEMIIANRQNGDGLLPGLITEVWTDQEGYKKIPTLTKPATETGILNIFNNLDAPDFGALSEDFILKASGYLFVEEDSVIGLRVISDDGSKVTINDQVILDNDGLHGNELKETTLKLSKGYHTIVLDYMQGKGGRYLSFEWKPSGANAWGPVPPGNLLHEISKHDLLKGKALSLHTNKAYPGDKTALIDVHPSFDLSQARPDDFTPKVGGMDFMSDGSLIISTWDPTGSVYKITNADSGDPSKIKATRIASGLAEPLGLKVIRDTIYVLQKQELTRLVDSNKDGIIDEYQCVNNRWPTSGNFHEFAFGLAEKNGDLYATLAIAILPGGASAKNQKQSRGKCVRFSLPSGEMSYMASGFRTPNGIGIGVDDEVFVADNQGDWLPSSKIVHVRQGDFFGSRAVDFPGTEGIKEKPPVVWLPQDEIGNSPSTPLAIQVGPYKGQMIHGEVTHGGVKRVFVEKINGEYQGVVFRFIQGLEAGVNRMVWGPDGALYVGGIGNPGNWQHSEKLWYGLQRLKYNDKPTFEMLAVRAMSNGVEIELTEPLKEGDGWNVSDWEVRQWRYNPTEDYGGPKMDDQQLQIAGISVSPDRKKVSLKLDGMKPGHVVYIHINNPFISDSGLPLWSTEAWYTMNQIPADKPIVLTSAPDIKPNTLTESEKASGWMLMFDGKTTNGWHTYGKNDIGSGWIVQDESLTLDAKKNAQGHWQSKDGGDIVYSEEFENFELSLEWKVMACGNSGIMFSVDERPDITYPWQTGPEMQILDNTCHPDSRYAKHKAGDLYDMLECSYEVVRPAGQWNQIRLIKKDGKVEHWMNGRKVVEYTMYDEAWATLVANSKFKDMAEFGKARSGKIALQDHGDRISFRNIKIRRL